MKKKIIGVLACAIFGAMHLLHAKVGCLDNSWHLKKKYDHKTYHAVSCSCDCDAQKARGLHAQNRDQCLECGHYHDPKPIVFLKKIVAKMAHNPLPESPNKAMDRLIEHWKRQKEKAEGV